MSLLNCKYNIWWWNAFKWTNWNKIVLYPCSISIIEIVWSNTGQCQHFNGAFIIYIIGCFATRIHSSASLTMATGCFHILIASRFIGCLRMAMAQCRHRLWPASMHTHRMIWLFVRKLPIRNFTRVTAAPTRPYAHMVPAFMTLYIYTYIHQWQIKSRIR